jgi:hypothetical protein
MSSKAPRFTRAVSGDNNRKPVSRQSVEESIQQPRPAVVTSSNDRDREHNENGGIQAKHGPAADMDKTFGTGCLVCGKHENEHQILLCEICDGEYHMYCLNPPLTQIPSEEWLCGKSGCGCVRLSINVSFKALANETSVSFELISIRVFLSTCIYRQLCAGGE